MQPIPENPIDAVVADIAEQRRQKRTPARVVMTKEFYQACRKQLEENVSGLTAFFTVNTIGGLPIRLGQCEWGHWSVMNDPADAS